MGNKHGSSKSEPKDKMCKECEHKIKIFVSPLFHAAQEGHSECLRAITMIYEFDEIAYAVDDVNEDNKTALILAIQNGHHECIDPLIKAGSDMNIPSHFPPVLEAIRSGHSKCIDVLLQSGADLGRECFSLKDMIGNARADQEQCVDVLRHTGADVNIILSTAEVALISAIANCYIPCVISLLNAGIDVNFSLECRSSPLMVAAAAGSRGLACTKMLLKVGAHVNITNTDGKNALQISIARSNDTNRDRRKCLLLVAAGEYLDPRAKSFTFMGQTYIIPDYLKDLDQRLCLKHLCRDTIRNYLIFLDPHLHLFGRITELRQPSLITRYLLYGMSLE